MAQTDILHGKCVVVGVTGGIAAYKVADVVSKLKKTGVEILVVMTKSATELISPMTFQTLSQNIVYVDMWTETKKWSVEHIAIADRADIFLVAPATANIIGKMAHGIADDMLSTTLTATTAPVLLCPAMNVHMFDNPVVQENMAKLKSLGRYILDPDYGHLACGYAGKGRLPDTPTILEACREVLREQDKKNHKDLAGKTVLVTAGPTREQLDPVRHLSNSSTGKMGYAVARQAQQRGAEVILISGPTMLTPPSGVTLVKIKTAVDMYEAVMANYEQADIIVKSAAVSDYRPAQAAEQKIKKKDGEERLVLELVRNPDILRELGKNKGERVLVGFAAETENLVENALSKYKKKNLDFIVANDITKEGAGFATDTNIAKIISMDGEVEDLPLMSKDELAGLVLDKVVGFIAKREQ